MPDAAVEEARRQLIAHENTKTLFSGGIDSSTAVMGLSAGMVLSLLPILVFGIFGLIVGFGGMLIWASRHSEKDKQRRVADLATADPFTIAERYCTTFHPDRGGNTWKHMSQIRDRGIY